MAAPRFGGFPESAIGFFRELGENNNKPWFEAHRGVYEESVREPSLLLADVIAERLGRVAAGPAPEPSAFRIYRDIRFSKDKSPYKTHMGIFFGDPAYKKATSPGFYFHLDAERLLLGAGLRHFEREFLEAYRQAVLDPSLGEKLTRVLAELDERGYDVWGETYKRVPRGLDPGHPRSALLRHSSLFAGRSFLHPPEMHGPELVDFCLEHFRVLAPLQHWLVEVFYR